MKKKLLKRNCWVLVRATNGAKNPIIRIVGVFKKKTELESYLKWLAPKDIEKYYSYPSKRFVYVDVWESKNAQTKD